MLDIIKEGIKLNQSLALLPLKAVRKLVNDKNTGAKQLVDVAEDMVSMPFMAASKAIDNTCQPCSGETRESQACQTAGGPDLKNVWVNPEVTVFSDVEVKPGQRRALLTVTGLLCGG
ncbi:MAG: hypothetical protein ACYC21_11240 [Eubacteriales bacterium]